ncbi:MAG: nucleotide pyrophosphohydrolase [Desulfobulbus sp.]|nr:MAG: nucleotide pyrophosphohydrolase [Desulfobulbus sp.]RUM39759.1 MAG: nucleotide pyrophosphohydrolase [Desulfobulbus sp.]
MSITKKNSPDSHPAERLYTLVKTLRGQDGCPWDMKQTPHTLKKHLLEETRELAEAIEGSDPLHVCEEIGDLHFILTLLTLLYEEQKEFSVNDTWEGIIEKMIRRHPHVFSDKQVSSEEELNAQWERIKAEEKQKNLKGL